MIASGAIAASSPWKSALFLMVPGCRMAMPKRVAASFTGETATSIPRPRGRSGCVTTSGREWPASTNLSRVWTAKLGVPQKTKSIGPRSQVSGVRIAQNLQGNRLESDRQRLTEQMFFLRPKTCHLTPASPFSRLHHLFDLALDEVALQ